MHLKEIQIAFISVLSDPDGKLASSLRRAVLLPLAFLSHVLWMPLLTELSQDVASKGLGLVYELGSEQDQQELVSTLVETLMTGKR